MAFARSLYSMLHSSAGTCFVMAFNLWNAISAARYRSSQFISVSALMLIALPPLVWQLLLTRLQVEQRKTSASLRSWFSPLLVQVYQFHEDQEQDQAR